jgi:hypothetical protein
LDKLLDAIGATDGSRKLFDEWVIAVRAAGGQPNMVQRLKRLNQVYTEIDANGSHWIIRGANPNKQTA